MPCITENTRIAYHVVSDLTRAVKSAESTIIVMECEKPDAVRKAIRRLINGVGWAQRVVIGLDGKMLFVRVKESTREKRLEEALEKILVHIENEGIFDEVMEALYGKNG